MQCCKKIGITGGIGSGKSTVCKVFQVFNIPIYNADIEARRIMNENGAIRDRISKLFGPGAYENDKLNRNYIAGLVFDDKSLLHELNQIVHPAVFDDVREWFGNQNSAYALYESALITKAGSADFLDETIFVYASKATRISRVIKRDQTSEEKILKRMQNQSDPIMRIRSADFIINNESTPIIPQVNSLHKYLTKKN